MNNNVRKLTDGAMMTAIVGLLLVINRQFAGILEDMLLFLFPLPMVFFTAKYGWKDGLLPFAAIVLLTIVLGTPQTIFYVASESLIGLIYGNGIRSKYTSKKLAVITIFAAVIVNLVTGIVLASFFGYNIAEEIGALQDVMNQVYLSSGTSAPAGLDMPSFLFTVYVVSTIMLGVMQGFITHVVSRAMLMRMRFEVPAGSPAAIYNPPKWTGYLAFAGMMLYLVTISRNFGSPELMSALQGIGMVGVMYLVFYGYVRVILFARGGSRGKRLLFMILGIMLVLSASLAMAFVGFLYITTGVFDKMTKGAAHGQETD